MPTVPDTQLFNSVSDLSMDSTMLDNTILFSSTSDLVKHLNAGNFNSEQLVTAFLAQIERHNPQHAAMVTINAQQALIRAKQADLARANGESWGRMHGVPITIKDNYLTAGIRTTAAYAPLKNQIPDQDATIVQLLKAEGAIILGKTNLSVLAMDMQATNPIFGSTNNPWDVTRTSGGSSGGCAAALATGMTPLSFGNDLAGSIRLPAAYCGVAGFKPSFGVVSLQGLQTDPAETVNGLKSLAVAGPLARSVADLELAFRIIAQPSPQDRRLSACLEAGIPTCPTQLRLAWTDEFGGVPVEAAIKRKIHAFVDQLTAAGVTMVKVCPPLNFDLAWKTWGSLVGMQGGYQRSNFSKWLGLPFTKGVLKHVPMHQNIVKPTSVEKYMIALNTQDEMINTMENFLDGYDGLICPSSAVTAFPHHAPSKAYGNFNIYNQPLKVDQTDLHYYMATQAYTTPFSLTESPVLALPLGLSEEGMPVGVQVVGKRHHDFDVLALGKMLEQYTEKVQFPLRRLPRQVF